MGAKITVWTLLIAFMTELFRQVEDNGNWQAMVFTSQCQKRFTPFQFDIGCINNSQFTSRQTFSGDKVQHSKGLIADTLVIFVVGNQATTKVRREHLGRLEVLVGKARLAGARGTD